MHCQDLIDRAVKIATKAAVNGHPVGRIIWIAPTAASEDPGGSWAIEPCPPLSPSLLAPWEIED